MSKQTTSKVPQIRFKGFSGEWEEQFLGELYTKIRNAFVGTATPYYTQKGHFYLQSNNVKNGEINRNTEVFINEEFYLRQKDNWLRSNDIVMVQSGHVGHTAVIPDELNNSAAHALIIISKPSRDTCSHYLNFYFQGNRAKRDLANITTGNTIKHILASEIKKFGAFFAHYEEQTQIGGYFREVDRLIGLHQRKHDKLLTLKKAMLQKMFPQPGTTTPEIRFKGFSGKWVENTIKSAAEPTTGFPFKSSDFSESGTYLVITNGNIQNELTFVDASIGNRISIQNSAGLNQFVLRVGDILVTMDGSVGRTAKVRETNQILAQRVGRLVPKLDSEFLYQALNTGAFLEAMTAISHGGTIKHISLSEIGDYLFLVPSDLEEQQKIGTYFRKLDDLISKHAIQLQKLTQIKSACLERMFV